jgi:amino acid adenylation domain-containing protein/non-ribosomal peptide synthase protein (TIGR01720 family)
MCCGDMERRVASLDKNKKELLQRLLAKEGLAVAAPENIPKRPPATIAPLSFAQRRLWLMEQMAVSGPPSYNMSAAYLLEGDLDVAAFTQAFDELLRRHEILRTRFITVDGEPCQEVVECAHTLVERLAPDHDTALSIEAFKVAAEALAREPFDLTQAPLVRVFLAPIGKIKHGLAVVLHHIVADGWSLPILMRELMTFYVDARDARPPSLPPLRLQYADYAQWHREFIGTPEADEHRAYWQRVCADLAPPLDLPSDYPRPVERSAHGADVKWQFGAELLTGLRALARPAGASLFMTLLACLKVLLSRYSQQEDLIVGTPTAGRIRPELADQIGFYVNLLPMRTTVDAEESFRALLGRLVRTTAEAVEHESYPFDQLVHDLPLERDLARSPLFDVVLVVDRADDSILEIEGLHVRPLELPTESSKFDLTFHFVEADDWLNLTVEYSTDLYKHARVERLARHLEELMRAVVFDPDEAVGRVPMVPGEEHAQVLRWGAVRSPSTWTGGIVERFESNARVRPDAIAASYENEHLTYAELNRRANQVANQLVSHGLGAEARVGVCLDRSLDLIVAILAVVKAGAAYVPLDPYYPAERLQYLVADSGLSLVLTRRSEDARQRLESWDGPVVDVDGAECTGQLTGNLGRVVHANQSAYVIYTSGSTGQPKGCVVTHGNLDRLMASTETWYAFDESDVWTLFHSYAFDFSVWEIWGALAYGGRLVVVPYWESRAPDAFLDLLAREQVTVLNQTPSAFNELMRADEQLSPPLALRYVIFGGEALDISALVPWFRRHGDTCPRLVNMYGITETTVHVTYRPICQADAEAHVSSVIGSPIPDLSYYLLDESLAPVPIGVTGEMYVGGDGVCRGYLDRPGLTAERFVPDQFSNSPGARLYRTGDRGRWTESGDVEYLGRTDTQVKIRGFRIEVGEVEAALRAQNGVADAIVLVRNHGVAQQLLGYVVTIDPAADMSLLRAGLEQRLPGYMIPARLIPVPARPLSAHGKLDMSALPEPQGTSTVGREWAPPRTDEERCLCEIWADALGVSQVGIDDNYFELGGDSILALRVIALARARGVTFGIRDLYQRRTIRALVSSTLDDGPDHSPQNHLPFSLLSEADRAVVPNGAEDAYPLTHLQAGMFFHTALDPASAVFHDVFSYRLGLAFHEMPFRKATDAITARHPVLRTSFHWDPYEQPLQVVWATASIAITVEDLRGLQSAAQDDLITRWRESEKHRAFEPTEAPLLRLHVHIRSGEDLELTADFHHAILDGWSFATFMSELVGHYLDLTEGRAVEMPAPSQTFRDFVALEDTALRSEQSRQFWADKLTELSVVRLPRWPRSPHGDGHLSHEVAIHDGARLQALAQQIGVPVKSICLATHMVVLATVTGQRDVVTGLTTNGRLEEEGSDGVLGLFLNTVPFRLDVQRDTWRSIVERSFEAERTLLAHRRFPLSAMKAIAGGRELYDAGFNFVHFHAYRAVGERLDILGTTAFEQTDYAFVANFSVDPRDGQLALRLSYDAAQFPADQIAALAGYYSRALSALASAPDESWAGAALLEEKEQARLVHDLGTGSRTVSQGDSILSRFEAAARQWPNAPAIIVDGQSLSYAELNLRSNRVAQGLRGLGVGPEVPVGLCLPRSEWLLPGLLGILKAGGAYVPIDTAYPEERIAYLLADSGAPVVLTDGSREGIDVRSLGASGAGSNPGPAPRCEQVAYVMYTSGSTGRPKGTMVSHGALLHYLNWAVDAYEIAPGERSIVHSSISFDATITSLLTPLLAGGAVELVPEGDAVLPLARALASDVAYRIVKITPAHLDLLRHELAQTGVRAQVGAFVIGGESLLESTLKWWRGAVPQSRLVNEYGPTETVVGCAVFEGGEEGETASVPIGQPIDRMRLYVLDRDTFPVPLGTTGEIYIAGAGVARGYHRRPDLTAERFLPDPFDADHGSRMYRTGDLGRWRPDGVLEYLGRTDAQVKVRGHRVELGEVEAVLIEHPAVTEAAVVARPVGTTHELNAFLVGTVSTLESVRVFLGRRLPEPLVPSRFVVLPELPLTPNGKVDRRALLDHEADALSSSVPFALPQTEPEKVLVGIWQDVLRKERVSVNEDYFASGGDSLKALQMVSRAARAGWQLRVRDVFDFPTIAELARHAGRDVAVASQEAVVGEVALTPIQRWFFEDHPGPYHHFNQSVMLRWQGPVKLPCLAGALTELVSHHDALRLRFASDADGRWHQEMMAPGKGLVDVQEATGPGDLDRLQASLDPAGGRLIRALVLRRGDADDVLLAVHHLAVDGVSWRVLLEDLETAYRQLLSGQAVRLPPKTISFKDWANRLMQMAASQALDAERAFWGSVASHSVGLPTDGPALGGPPEVVSVSLDAPTTERLLGPAHGAYRTRADDLLLTGLAMALEQSFGVRHALVTLEGHGRHEGIDADVSRTVGWFTSRYPVALELADGNLRERIRCVKESLRRIPGRGFGYGLLRYLAPNSSRPSLECRPAVGFNYLGRFDAESGTRCFDITDEPTGAVVGPDWPRAHEIDIVATVFAGRLDIRMDCVPGRFRPERLQAFADAFVASLRQIADHCASRLGEPTPSDLTFQGLSLTAFDTLLRKQCLEPEDVEDILPLSPMQEGFLVHALHEREGAYFEQSAYRLSGRIEADVFEEAWNRLLIRHQNLRVTFWHEDVPQPMQVVLKGRRVEFLSEDWRRLEPGERVKALEGFREKERRRGFDLSADPLVRVALFQVGDAAYDAVWSFPHLLLDGWSAGILLGELLAIYGELVDGRPAALPESAPYRRYLQWLARQDRDSPILFWARYLDGYEETASVPSERNLGARQNYVPLSMPWRLDADDTQRIKVLAARLHVTVNTVIQTLWAVLLTTYTERRDVVFGATVSGRPESLPGVERMVGLFINTLPVRVQIEANEGFVSLVQRVQADALAAQEHAACPLAEIQAQSALHSHLFDHILVFENYPLDEQLQALEAQIKVESSDVFEQIHYDLGLLVADGMDHLAMRFIANGAAYPEQRLARMVTHFVELTANVLAETDRPVWQHRILPPAEQRQLHAFNDTVGEAPRGLTLVDLLSAQTALSPDATAIIHGKTRLSYASLNARADAWSDVLRTLGVGPETLVGVFMSRQPDIIVAILAVLKAGGSYVPLDPNYPSDRLEFLVEDAGMPLVLTETHLRSSVPQDAGVVLCLDEPMPQSRIDVVRSATSVKPEHLAYLIYTSGSTGTPKGVAISHAAAVALVEWGRHTYCAAELHRVLASTSICFDLSVFEIFVTLSAGGAIVMAENALELPSLDAADEVTLVNTVPSAMTELVRIGGLPASVRTVNLAGEPLSPSLVDDLYAVETVRRVCDLYGPSEDTTYSTFVQRTAGGPETIGRPLTHSDTAVHLLDYRMEPVPIGFTGEVYIASDKLCRGYWNRAGLTADRFVPNPWSRVAGGRMYRTGDLARYRDDGQIEFLGRLDHQVKIRGFRIELGEIEAVLGETGWLRDAAVVAREDTPGDKRVVAYIVPAEEAPRDGQVYREYLAQKLPDYMVPAAIVALGQLPLTPNGKLDRRSLPMPDGQAASDAQVPRTTLEEMLATAWGEALDMEEVGVFDNFFDHGGHSLKAVRLVSRARQEHGLDLSIKDVFTHPTIAELAEHLCSRERVEASHIALVADADDYLLSYGQRRLWVLDKLRGDGPAAYNVPAAFVLQGPLDARALRTAFHTVLQRHEVLRTSIEVRDGEPRQRVLAKVDMPFSEFDWSTVERPLDRFDAEVRRLAHAPFDLEIAPLIRVALAKFRSDRHGLAVVVHHIATDGWSIPILMRELVAAYRDAAEGRTSPLPNLRVQYKDFSVWQRAQVDGQAAAVHRAYWQQTFADLPPPLALPTDDPRPAVQTFEGRQYGVDLEASLAARIRTFAEAHGVSLYMLLLAAMKVLLARMSGQEDVTVGSPMAGRTHPDLDDQIGYYVNTVPLRTTVRGADRFVDLLARVRDVVSAAYEHQIYPFDRIVDDLDIERDLSRSPLFDVMVAMEPSEGTELALPGVHIERHELDYRVSKFDLTTTFVDRGTAAGILIAFEYNTNLFRQESIVRMVDRFQQLLEGVVEQPRGRIDHLTLLPSDEYHAVTERWNWERLVRRGDQTLQGMFEAQAMRTPDAIALVYESRRLTYRELDRRSNAVAHHLVRDHAVQLEEPVGLVAEASEHLIVGLLGILKAGGAYVPLDPLHPEARIAWIKADANIRIVVNVSDMPPGEAADPPRHAGSDQRLAYVLYTSGSTGQPKGVAVSHRGVSNLLADAARRQPLRPGGGCALWTSLGFDVSVYEVFSALLSGGRLCIATNEMRTQPKAYFECLAREQIASAYVAPFQLAELLEFVKTNSIGLSLERLLVGVEPIDEALLASLQDHIPGLHVINGYGPTEASICATLYDVPEQAMTRVTPIGRAVANTAAYVVDRQLQPVGLGVAGEIVLAGDGLARGYHANPAATASAFVPNPFGPPGSRLYRTGDKGRRLADGDLVFGGRSDHQVKIRGHRVEVGEVEHSLRFHPDVAAVAVVARPVGTTHELVAYLEVSVEVLTVDALRVFLEGSLPDYMIPARYVAVDALPLTPSGKVDRLALRDHEGQVLSGHAEYVEPSASRESVLAQLWADVLGTEQVGVHDNYFSLGGDSIKAIQIAARAADFGLSLTIRDVFEHPTVAQLAEAASDQETLAPRGPVTGGVPLTPIQAWFFSHQTGPYDHFNQAVLLHWAGAVDEAALRSAGTALMVQHDGLRSRFEREASGTWSQVVEPMADIEWVVEDLREYGQGDAVARMSSVADDVHAGLDLAKGRLVAGGLFRLPDGDRVLLVIHHLVVDGVSWRVLFEDLNTAYRQAQEGAAPQLQPKTESFQAWAASVQANAEIRDDDDERRYWEGVCAVALGPLLCIERGGERESVGETLDESDTKTLLARADAQTVAELLGTLGLAIRDLFGRSRVVVNLEGHGREQYLSDLEVGRTVGWFTSLYPFVLDVGDGVGAGDAPLRAAIDGVRRSLVGIPRKGVGYGLLRYRGANAAETLDCRADVSFNYLGQFDTGGGSDLFAFASESSGQSVSPDWQYDHALDVSAHVSGGQFHLSATFDTSCVQRDQALRLLQAHVQYLRELAAAIRTDADDRQALLVHYGVSDQDIEAMHALSPTQEGMLFAALFEDDSPAYFEQITYRIRGDIDPATFESTWNCLLMRHPNLRASIWHEHTSRPIAAVRRERRVDVQCEDWTGQTPQTQRTQLDAYRRADRARGFDLATAPLLRFGLFRTGAETWEVVWSYPHLLLDGWSTGILLGEFLEQYGGDRHALPAPVPYTDYLQWLTQQDHAAALARWRVRLEGYDSTASIPSGDPSPGVAPSRRQSAVWTMPDSLAQQLTKASACNGVTLNTLVQTCWALLLGRLSNRTDVVFGATVSGRPENLPGVEKIVGLFINTLPVRISWREDETVASLARRVQRESMESLADGFVPLADIQAESAARSGLLDHLFVFENYPVDQRFRQLGSASSAWDIDSVEVFEETHYSLVLAVVPTEGRLEFKCVFDPKMYSSVRIERLWQQWEQIVESVGALDCPVRQANVVTESERQLIVNNFARGARPTLTSASVLDLLCAPTMLGSTAVAVTFGAQSLTRQELHGRACGVARALHAAGVVGLDTPVAIYMERSIEMVVGLLGILLSGGAYVAIDPGYPPARVQFILEDSGVSVVLTEPGLLGDEVAPAVRRLCTIGGETAMSGYLAPAIHPASLAYVAYTSGSTGTPKPVGITHGALANHMAWMARALPLQSDDRVLQKTPYGFDASVWEFWAPLMEAATLVMADPGIHQDPRLLAETVRRERITVLQVVPTMLQALVEEPLFGECHYLRRVVAGGEVLSGDLQRRFSALLPAARLFNFYGPTETTVDSTWAECLSQSQGSQSEGQSAIIGRPIDGLVAHVLDQRMEPAPIEAWGELYLGGIGVARGYLGQSALTASRFLPDAFGGELGGRLYRSGDRARWRADGTLEYGGRLDDQVKLRGFRVELGEVEAALLQLEGVAEAAAVVVQGTELRAYLVTSGPRLDTADVRRLLLDGGLPAWLIPGHLIFLDALPRTTSGKLNRRTLLEVEEGGGSLQTAYMAPRDDRDAAITTVWARTLSAPQIGIHHNFFDLGGHSLTAARVAAQLSRDMAVSVTVRDVFTYPTVAELADYLTAAAYVEVLKPTEEAAGDDSFEDVII